MVAYLAFITYFVIFKSKEIAELNYSLTEERYLEHEKKYGIKDRILALELAKKYSNKPSR